MASYLEQNRVRGSGCRLALDWGFRWWGAPLVPNPPRGTSLKTSPIFCKRHVTCNVLLRKFPDSYIRTQRENG